MARMLSRQAHDGDNPAQFIVTTFHPQVCFCIHTAQTVKGGWMIQCRHDDRNACACAFL